MNIELTRFSSIYVIMNFISVVNVQLVLFILCIYMLKF